VTSRSTEIQTLIADIDNLLANNKGKRLVRVLSNQGQEPRQVLERVRNFLASIEEQPADSQSSQAALLSPLLARYIGNEEPTLDNNYQNQSEIQDTNSPQAQFGELRGLLEPLQIEFQALLEERKNLVEEIRQLEQQRLHNYSLASQMANQEQMIAEFLQVLANRVSGIAPQLQVSNETVVPAEKPVTNELIERISQSYSELDKKIVDFDSSLNLSFEALQRHLNGYRESLTDALTRMHSEGMQGEQLLKHWIDNVMQQLQSVNIFLSELANKSQTQPETKSAVSLPDIDTGLVEDANATPDLDALLLELNPGANNVNNVDTSISIRRPVASPQTIAITNTSTQIQKSDHKNQFQGDEVDLLYASLFGNDDVSISSQVASPVPRNPISVTQDLPIQEAAPTPTHSEVTLNTISTPDTTIDTLNTDDIVDTSVDVPDSTSLITPLETVVLIPEETQQRQILEEVNTLDIPVNDAITSSQPETAIPITVLNQKAPEIASTDLQKQVINITPEEAPLEVETPETEELVNIEPDASNSTFVPDPWLDSTDVELLDLHDFQTQHQETSIAEQTSNAWLAFVNTDNVSTISDEPTAADTIAVLTDLVFEAPEFSSTGVQTENLQNHQNNFITASPKEVLLSQATEAVDEAMPNISLDEEQIQRLDRDLENFDSEQYVSATDQKQSTQQSNVSPADPPVSDIPEAIAAQSQIIETKQPALGFIDNNYDIPDTGSAWYLGIDLGTTGISAALLNRLTAEVYPLYWSTETDINANSAKRSFRLPGEVYLPEKAGVPIGSVQYPNVDPNVDPNVSPTVQNLFSAELKPYLQIALPYKSEKVNQQEPERVPDESNKSHKWEPVLQLNEVATVPLVWMVRSLSKLLLTLKSDRNSTTLGLTATAMGVSQHSFSRIIDNISGVVCSCPSNWSEQYRFNIREALLLSKLISHPQQVFFVEEAIASLLSELDGANGEKVKLNTRNGFRPAKSSDHPLQGNTLVMNIGASATEMGLVELPENLLELSHNDFMLHSFAYGGKGIEIDILCQLLLPPKWRQPSSEKQPGESITSNPLHWQPSILGLENTRLSSLKWEELTLPRPGEPDIAERIRLLQRLESSRLGQALLDAATAMKLILQHQESFSLSLADQRWVLQRRDLESQVFVPFVRRLNRELNRLLVARGIPTEAINQAILTGGVATLGAVSRWLRQKLPNARIIQDLYLGENGAPTCSRVAYGLSLLPLHPQVLEVSRQQYTDYFLFTELLRVLPEHALTFGEVIGLFEERGINTRNCQQRLLAFLEGELPAGLVPGNIESMWLTQASIENFDYKALWNNPLFEKQGSLTYRPNIPQIQYLRSFLDTVKASTQQSLEEPYTVNFAVGVPM
jgi:hypothetical protein